MVERREVMGGGLIAGMAALLTPAPAPAPAAAQGNDDGERIVRAVNDLEQSVRREFEILRAGPWRVVDLIREQQRNWLRATQKYPDFIEVGVAVWESLHEWHVRYQQPLNVARQTDGRYAMAFMFTTILLRPELQPEYVSLPYDTPRR
jgi:hypothetical protein